MHVQRAELPAGESISSTVVFDASVMEGGANISVQRMTVNIKDCR